MQVHWADAPRSLERPLTVAFMGPRGGAGSVVTLELLHLLKQHGRQAETVAGLGQAYSYAPIHEMDCLTGLSRLKKLRHTTSAEHILLSVQEGMLPCQGTAAATEAIGHMLLLMERCDFQHDAIVLFPPVEGLHSIGSHDRQLQQELAQARQDHARLKQAALKLGVTVILMERANPDHAEILATVDLLSHFDAQHAAHAAARLAQAITAILPVAPHAMRPRL